MDARTNSEARPPSHHPTEGLVGAVQRSSVRAVDADLTEIFKKSPCIPDLKAAGRHVAKDMIEFGGIPLPLEPTSSAVSHPGGKAEIISYADA
jgi:hypothetical protein